MEEPTPRSPDVAISDFEQAKWEAELALRQREIAIKEAEQRNRDDDLALRREELSFRKQDALAARWTSPLVVAVLAAAIAGLGNAGVAVINGRLQRDREYSGAESNLILEVVKTGDPDKAANNLKFLADIGLVTDKGRVASIRSYLKNREPGAGIALPADKNFTFEKTADATPDATRSVSNVLTPYIKHLVAIGFPQDLPQVEIKFKPDSTNPSYYLPNEKVIVLSKDGAKDALFPIAEYTIHALELARPTNTSKGIWRVQMEYGVRDYLAASYLNEPDLGHRVKAIYGIESPSLNLLLPRNYRSVTASTEPHEAGAVWAAALWKVRDALGAPTVDALVAQAWRTMTVDGPDERAPAMLLTSFKSTAASRLGSADQSKVAAIFRDFGFAY